jgi:peptide/nickel transport system ATP-binding protein
MYAGRIVESGPVARVSQALAHPYTAGLLASTVHGQPREHDIGATPSRPPEPAPSAAGLQLGAALPPRTAECRRAIPEPWFPEPGHMTSCQAVSGAVGLPALTAARVG